MNSYQKTSHLVKSAREKKGLTQTQLALRLGYSCSQFVSNVERNKCAIPPKKFKLCAKILGVKTEALLEAYLLDTQASILKQAGLAR